ncbi:MAG: hypothetical protein AAF597_21685, partial [Bacteroidota bacterium]
MSFLLRTATLLLLLLTSLGCQRELTSSLDSLEGSEWEFSLDNPIKPEGYEIVFSPGFTLTVGSDSATLFNPVGSRSNTYPLQNAEDLTDTLEGSLMLQVLEDGLLEVTKLRRGQIIQKRRFVPKQPERPLFDLDKLAGNTYWFTAPGQERSRVHFGYDELLALAKESKYYYVPGYAAQEEPRSLLQVGGTFHGDLHSTVPRPVRQTIIFISPRDPSALGSTRFEIYYSPAGEPVVEYISVKDGKFVREQVGLSPLEEGAAAARSIEDFCTAINTGTQ